MRGVLLILILYAVYFIPEAQNASLPDVDEFDEATTETSNNDDPYSQPSLVNSEYEENTTLTNEEIGEKILPEARNLEGNGKIDSESSSVASLPDTTEEVGIVEDIRTKPRIEPGSCGPPPNFERTTIVSGKNSTYGPGSVVTYSCQFGYVIDGFRQVKCTLSEDTGELEWSQTKIRCAPRSCGDPGEVDHAKRIGSLFTFPNRVSFECEEGYVRKGNSARYCQPSGTWSGELPKCQKLSCKPPPDIKNGKVSYTSLEFGSELQYKCDPGFILRNYQTRYCAGNKTWSGKDPVCQDAQCELPVSPKGGSYQLLGDKPAVDTRVIFKCDGNKILSGNRVSICMENGYWTFPPPTCLDPCSIPTVPHGKIMKYSYGWKEVPVGSVVDSQITYHLYCESNYEPLGQSQKSVIVKCGNGVWEDEPRCEPASCQGSIPQTKNGYVTYYDRKNQGEVYYRCSNHFNKTRTGNVTCISGTWIGNTPVCSDTRCYFSKLPLNGLKKPKDIYYHGQSFKPDCENRYTPKNSHAQLKCESGEWKGPLPPCTPASCKGQPPGIDYGRFKHYSGDHSSTVQYECEDGFVLIESSKVECLFGEWSGTPPKCQDSRCYHKDLLKTHGLEINEDGFTPSEEYMAVKCTEGFTVKKNSEPFCSAGVWKQPDSPCEEDGCTSSKVLNGGFQEKKVKERLFRSDKVYFEKVALNQMYKPGDKLFVNCEGQFTFQGNGGNNVEVTCSKGEWEPEPVCLATNTPFEPKKNKFSTRPTKVTSRPNVASPTSVVGRPGPAEVCSCTYVNSDDNLVGISGPEILQSGTSVKQNCRIKFSCRQFGYHILRGPTELVCDRCQDWHSSEYPQCVDPTTDDVLFWFPQQVNISIGNEITLKEGQLLEIHCFSYLYHDIFWTYKQGTPDIHFKREQITLGDGQIVPTVVLEILANVHNGGVYSCQAHINRPRPRIIRVKVISARAPPQGTECPYIEETEVLAVNYENGQKANSQVSFSCKKQGATLVGDRVITCRFNGQWSGETPRCNHPVQCPELHRTDALTIAYSNGRFVGSTASFHCFRPRQRLGESHATCRQDGSWSSPVPLCLLPNCSLEALFRSFPEHLTVANGERNSDSLPYNSTVNLRCKNENLRLIGERVATCKDGNWTVPNNLQCISGCALPQPPDEYLIIEPSQSSYNIGESIVLSCPAGMELSRNVERLMCLPDGWSETQLPSCSLH